MLDQADLKKRLEFCKMSMIKITPTIMSGFQNPKLTVERKLDGTHVTEIDKKVEEKLRRQIEKEFPGEKIFGEEFGETSGNTDFSWFIDPIDGTCSFASGVPLFGSMIGIALGDRALLGYVHFPALDETIYAGRGLGTMWKPQGKKTFRKSQVSKVKDLSQALFSTTSREGFAKVGRVRLYDQLCDQVAFSRGWSDCYGHLLVATGRAELMVDAVCSDWDSVPFQVITEEAGGSFFNLEGEATAIGKSMISVNGHLSDQIVKILKRKK